MNTTIAKCSFGGIHGAALNDFPELDKWVAGWNKIGLSVETTANPVVIGCNEHYPNISN